ncbi:MAG TPA: LuxR C-terminal-related transcriptional regulator [Mycobacterium sp.]
MAAKLLISPCTVQTHLSHIFRKLGVASCVQLHR